MNQKETQHETDCCNETKIFWDMARELRSALKTPDAPGFAIGELIEECEVMLELTENEEIRARCRELLAEARRPRLAARAGVLPEK